MKKQIKKLQLNRHTLTNLTEKNLFQLKGGIYFTAFEVCHTKPKYCGTTKVSACTECISCIECNPPRMGN
jgi:hypothetical protein